MQKKHPIIFAPEQSRCGFVDEATPNSVGHFHLVIRLHRTEIITLERLGQLVQGVKAIIYLGIEKSLSADIDICLTVSSTCRLGTMKAITDNLHEMGYPSIRIAWYENIGEHIRLTRKTWIRHF